MIWWVIYCQFDHPFQAALHLSHLISNVLEHSLELPYRSQSTPPQSQYSPCCICSLATTTPPLYSGQQYTFQLPRDLQPRQLFYKIPWNHYNLPLFAKISSHLAPYRPPLTSPKGPCRMILLCMALVCKVPISTWRTRWYRWELYTQEPCRVRSSFNPPPFLLHPNLLHKRYTLFFITSFWLIPLIPLILPLSHHLLSFNPLLLFIFALPPNSDIRHPWMKLTLSIYCVPLHFKLLHCICGNRTARLTKQL